MSSPHVGWLKKAMAQQAKPKESVIGVLKKNLGGVRQNRSRSQLHASDITQPDFCPRQWALHDLQGIKAHSEYLPLALQTTFDLGCITAKTLIEEWAGDDVVGNWVCRRCEQQRTMTSKPKGICPDAKGKNRDHIWEYEEVTFEAAEYGLTGSIDALFILGPLLRVTELKILAAEEFDKILAPQSEHRIRTSLYMRLIAESNSVYKSRFNLHEATVLYVSRGFGRKNPEHLTPYGAEEIMPFREFVVERDDAITKEPLQKAKALKIFREEKKMPTGICATAVDKFAKKCDVCSLCFGGQYKPEVHWENL
jgi:hypothetical protein